MWLLYANLEWFHHEHSNELTKDEWWSKDAGVGVSMCTISHALEVNELFVESGHIGRKLVTESYCRFLYSKS